MPAPAAFSLPSLPTRPGDHRRWHGMPGAGAALALAEASSAHDGALIVVVSSNQRAAQLHRELRFFAADPALDILLFPDTETLPYDIFSPTPDISSARFGALYRLETLSRGVVITSLPNLLRRLPPVDYLHAHCLTLDVGQRCDPIQLRDRLESGGYQRVDTVRSPGECALRGGLIDVFPMGSSLPCRIDLLDTQIESLRLFDPGSQRTVSRSDRLRALPTREYPLDADAIRRFRNNWHQRFNADPRHCRAYRDISDGKPNAGAECYLPLFFDTTADWFDYLPDHSLLFVDDDAEPACARLWQDIVQRRERGDSPMRPLLPAETLFLNTAETLSKLKKYPAVHGLRDTDGGRRRSVNLKARAAPTLRVGHVGDNPLEALESFLRTHERVLLCAASSGREQAINDLLRQRGLSTERCASWLDFHRRAHGVCTVISPLERGVLLPDGSAVITETELFGHSKAPTATRASAAAGTIIKSLAELTLGAPVVHIEHGVGRYQGLQTLSSDDRDDEYLCLEYADASKLYVPVTSLNLVTRYNGADGAEAPLHRLGSANWQRARRRAAEKIRDVAADLLHLHADRITRDGIAHALPESYAHFAAECPFALTEDQQAAVDSVLGDMQRSTPMDRLVSGDVGFGKTEVAMRAAYVAVANGLQVALLAPTTLLTQQHYESLSDRFSGHAARIATLSRFRSAAQQRELAAALAAGDVDIVIGTHRLLGPDIHFAALGLIIIDEEHRFGVRHKARLRAARSHADCLSLTATPIPRTLHHALEGLTELSIIATPPPGRMPIKTFVVERSDELVREALARELLRGGQSYYLHNDVRSIDRRMAEISEMMPEARVGVAHGQMGSRPLADAMDDFYRRRTDVLVCSTIIESGIDASNANTIVIDRADKLGLAQLHQLRGRVGRGDKQAYAWLLAPPVEAISRDAKHRLDAIAQTADLGIGFHLACHDLEIRGAGNLLGEEQSGQIHEIGFSAYTAMLEQAVASIRAGQLPSAASMLRAEREINLHIPLRIPDDYLPDIHTRLIVYQRVNDAPDEAALAALNEEMVDRFGPLPSAAQRLFGLAALKLAAAPLKLDRIEASAEGGMLHFNVNTPTDPGTVLALARQHPDRYRMPDGQRLALRLAMPDPDERLASMRALIDTLRAGLDRVAPGAKPLALSAKATA